MATRTIRFVCVAVQWRDKTYGNTYHSCRVTRCRDGAVLACPMQYGYGDHYRQTALQAMLAAGWLPKTYTADTVFWFERENNYPIQWTVSEGRKRDCEAHGKEE